jgi:hypothetical protein
MALWFAGWSDRTSLLIDAESKEIAHEIASTHEDGAPPERLVAVPPRAIVFEVRYDPVPNIDDEPLPGGSLVEIDAEEEELVVEPLPAAEAILAALEEDEPIPVCGSEAEDREGRPISCIAPHGHPPPHVATRGPDANEVLTWEDPR